MTLAWWGEGRSDVSLVVVGGVTLAWWGEGRSDVSLVGGRKE